MASKNFHHPFQPYDIQQEFMQAVYDCIENGKVGIFESPTGTGKSLSLICGSLTWLREHKRKQFDEAMQSIEVDEDEPAWMAEHAREIKRKEILHMRAEFEARLANVREKERKLREKQASGEPFRKRRKQGGPDEEGVLDDEDQFALDDYNSDDEAASHWPGESQYSTETTKLLEKLGMIAPTKDDRDVDDAEEELKIFFCSRTHSQLSQFVGELQRVHLPAGLPPEQQAGDSDDVKYVTEEVKQITLGSRKNLCINSKVNKLASQTAINCSSRKHRQTKSARTSPAKTTKVSCWTSETTHSLLYAILKISLVWEESSASVLTMLPDPL
jgi:chromosome transmission fidelity protein 1